MALKVSGTNFPAQAAILWNGTRVTTAVVDSNTLSGTIGSSSLANPGTAQLQVQNTQTMQESPAVQVTIAAANTGSSLTLSITSLPQGVVGSQYAGAFAVTGGTSPYVWSIDSGQLPPGLSLAADTGAISGVPTSAGNYSFDIRVTDSGTSVQSATTTVSLPVVAASSTPTPLTINSSSLPSGTTGSPYSSSLQAGGGTAPYSWAFTSGSLPAGVSLAANGTISGNPAVSGTFSFTATVADSASPAQTKSATFSLVVAPPSIGITTTTVPSGTIGSSYSSVLQASGGIAPYAWSITSGALPSGLTLAATSGVISGTPTATGTFSFTVTVADAESPALTKSAGFSFVVTPASLAIITSSLPAGTQGSSYNRTLQATGGTTPYNWSITTGALPTGLTLSATTGMISGTPTVSGNFSFGVTVQDAGSPAQTATATVTLSLVAAGTPLAISSTSVPAGATGQIYNALLNATGGTGPYTWSITSGTLPAGLSLATSTGTISGTPTASGSTSLTFKVVDSSSPAQAKSITLTLVIAQALVITTASLPSGTKGSAYSNTMAATGGTTPYSWSIGAGSLPAGLSLASTTGLISGTPNTKGTFGFTVTVTDAGNPAQAKSVAFSLVVAPATLAITTSSLASGTQGTSYSNAVSATGGTTPYIWSISSGALPAGLSLASSTGLISGTPTAAGTFSFTATVADAGSPAQVKSVNLSIAVAAAALAITTSSVPSSTQGTAYSNSLSASGGSTPYSWSITSGSLPAGLSLASSTGLISGTPTATGTSSFTATVADAGNPAQTKSANLSIVVAPAALAITTTSLSGGTANVSFSSSLNATGGTAPYTWSITSGTLPAGLSLAPASGTISGTPTVSGSTSLTFKVTDSSNPALTKSVTLSLVITSGAPSSLTISATLPSGTVNTGYSSAMTATGGTPAYTWSISAGSLPPGLTLAATSGTISGTPSTSGTYNFTATVSDNGSPVQTQSAATSIVIAAATTSGTVWHIRQDGGNNTQCTGTTNAAYPGSGTAQPCAYNHPYQMLNYSGAWTSFAAGDTMEFDDPPTNTTPYYIGEQNGGLGSDWSTQMGGVCPPPNSPAAAGSGCMLPILPNNVTIKGQNYGNCHTAGHTGLVNPTILSGINGVFTVLFVQGTNGVTISCIEVTQPDTCTSAGTGHGPGQCGSTNNYVNYAGLMLEYETNQGPANMTLTDFAVVGTSNRGILGSHLNLQSTDTFTASDIYLIGNGQAGWDGDGGGCGTSCESVGTMNLSYLDIEWNGCLAVEPYNLALTPEANPNGFNYCYGQNTSGYGDGFVQIAAGNLTLNVTHSTFKYNTQDGFDAAHLSDDPTTTPATNISSSWSEGNAGQTFKIGAGASSTAINNVSISNCHVLSQPATFPNNPSGWVTLDGGDTCRAAGDEWSLTLRNGTSITLENNTSLGYGTTMYDLECSLFDTACGSNGATVVFMNNLSKGYPNPGNSGQ